jgi:hypothetical protein
MSNPVRAVERESDHHDRTLFALRCAPCHEIGGALRVTPGSQGSPARGARSAGRRPDLDGPAARAIIQPTSWQGEPQAGT